MNARLRVSSSRALSRLCALFHVGAWCSDPGTHVWFRFHVGVRTLALHVLSLCVSVRSRVCSSVHVCFVVLHAVRVSIGCVHSCYILCCVARSLCISLAACFHVVMSCVNMWLMSFLICCVFVFCTWLVICLLAMCLCFVLCEHVASVLVFCVPCALMLIVLTHPSCYPFID